MKFFIDTANLAQIKEAHELGILDGVTTNPSLMAKEGIAGKENILAHYKAICNIVDDKVDIVIKQNKEIKKDMENQKKELKDQFTMNWLTGWMIHLTTNT
mgnify:CR=1 FL=1